MDLEQQLRGSYVDRLGSLDVPGGDVGAARRTGARLKARRRLAVGVAAATVVAVAAVGHGLLVKDRASIGPSHSVGQWRELPPAPLSPRARAAGVWTGHEVIVVGGEADPCPPNTDFCARDTRELRDGAAYDPATNAWHPIAKAPVPVEEGDSLVSAGGKVVLRHPGEHTCATTRCPPADTWGWYVYDPVADSWSDDLGGPPSLRDSALSVLGSDVYGIAGRHVVSYDVGSGLWSRLPVDRNQPRLVHRQVTATAVGPVLTGYDATRPDDGTVPSVVLADVFDGTRWHRLPATGQLGNTWHWTGSSMFAPDPEESTGGAVNAYPHAYPEGGFLDPSSGRWSPLSRDFSARWGSGWGIYAVGGRWAATYGQVYDTQTGHVTLLPPPAGAPDASTTVWAGDVLMAFGGVYPATGASDDAVTNRAWLYTP
jgi:hypothetical protein